MALRVRVPRIASAAGGAASVAISATESSDLAEFIVASRVGVSVGATEGDDVASFSIGVISTSSFVSFSVLENEDSASFSIASRQGINLSAFENSDSAAFSVASRHAISLGALENEDSPSFSASVIGGTLTLTLSAVESEDVASFSLLNPEAITPGGHYGAWWLDKYANMFERKKPKIKEIIEEIKENPDIFEKIPEIKNEIFKKYPDFDYKFLQKNQKLQRVVANLIQKQIQFLIQEEEDLEVLIL